MYRKILVPVDGSPSSSRGLAEAIKLARNMNSTIRLVHVVNEYIFDPAYTPSVYYEPWLEALRSGGREILERSLAMVRDAGVECQTGLIETIGGSVAQLILADAKAWQPDLIVMGTHGRRGVSRVVLGSDAETVLRAATVPVLLVRDTQKSGA